MGERPLDPDLDPVLRFKRLTPNNWLRPDATLAHFVQLTAAGAVPISAQDWAERFLAVELDARVPLEVRQLFAVARAVFVYGAFFYPLYGLGQERLFTVADAAVLHSYRANGGQRSAKGEWPRYVDRLRALGAAGLLDPLSLERWQALRTLRNLAAHADRQTIVMPGQAFGMLETVGRDIDSLFAAGPATP
jgi:hypothetical protein